MGKLAEMKSLVNRDGVRIVEMVDDRAPERLDTRYTLNDESEGNRPDDSRS